jgi:hypothetical protein
MVSQQHADGGLKRVLRKPAPVVWIIYRRKRTELPAVAYKEMKTCKA